MNHIDPVFVKISENLDTPDIPDDLIAEPFNVTVGDHVNIGGKNYEVHYVKDEDDNFKVKNSKDDLRNNLRAYEELHRAGLIRDFPIDDLCLRNLQNGNVLIEIKVPDAFYRQVVYNKFFQTEQKHFFVRLDSSMINTRMRDKQEEFEATDIKMTPCMFAADSALAITESGQKIPITERSSLFEEKITDIYINPRFTFYEREILSRLVGTVNLLAYSKHIDQVTTVLPQGAYYSFLIKPAAQGIIRPDLVLEWFEEVDLRVKYLKLLIKKGIHDYHPGLNISQYSFMDSACEAMRAYFQERVDNPELPIVEQDIFDLVMKTILEKDAFARQVFDSDIKVPQNFRELADFTYAICNLTDMYLEEGKEQPKKLILGVFDVSETMAWNVTKKIRNRGLLAHRGQFDPKKPKNTTYDNLSYINVMPVEHIIFDLSDAFIEQYMGGSTRLYAVRQDSLPEKSQDEIIEQTLGPAKETVDS